MKRYFVSYKRYGIISTVLPLLFIFNGVLYTIKQPSSDGFLGAINQYAYILWFSMGAIALLQAYRIYSKKIYLEINETCIIHSFIGKGIVHNYTDVESYTVKQSGKTMNIFYKSIDTGKKKVIPLNIFEVDSNEFLVLLSKNSNKEIYVKRYGEELKLFEIEEYL